MMSSSDDIHVDIVVPNKKRYLSLIGNIAEEVARALDHYDGDREALAYHLNVVLTEAMVNAIEHSTAEDVEQTVRVCIMDRASILRRFQTQIMSVFLSAVGVSFSFEPSWIR